MATRARTELAPVSFRLRESWRELVEIAVVYILLEAALWTRGRVQLAWGFTALGCAALITLWNSRTIAQLGIGLAGLRSSFYIVPAAAALGGLAVLVLPAGGLNIHGPLWHSGLYALWAMIQEFLVQSFIFVRLEVVFGARRAIVLSALLFSLAHLPNPVLMVATFVMGLSLTYWFWRHRNLYPLGVAHAVLGLALAVSLPDEITHRMHVGAGYFASPYSAQRQVPARYPDRVLR